MKISTDLMVLAASLVALLLMIVNVVTLVEIQALSEALNAHMYGSVPACTDAIADAGGICHGEPR